MSGPASRGPASGGSTAPKPPPPVVLAEVPAVLGGFRLKRATTQNELGAVYPAEAVGGGTPADLVVLHQSVVDDPSVAARTGYALLLASRLKHPNLLAVGGPQEENGLVFVAVEPLPAATLGDGLRRGRRLAPDTAVGLVLQAAEGLSFLHAHGLVHRRVNPNTLTIASGAVVKVADWGSVHTSAPPPFDPTSPHPRVAAADYRAPELLHTPTLRDPRVDVYGLGCTLRALLTSRTRVKVGDGRSGPSSRAEPGVDTGLALVLAHATAAQPERRNADMGEFAAALHNWQRSRSPAVTPDDQAAFGHLAREYARASAPRWWPAAVLTAVAVTAAVLSFTPSALLSAGFLCGAAAAVAAAVVGRMLTATTELGQLFRPLVGRWWVAVTAAAVVAAGLGLAAVGSWTLALTAVGSAVVGATAGLAYATLRDRADRRRDDLAARGHTLLKLLRLNGADESTLHLFVKLSAVNRWEPIARRLFGPAVAVDMRQRSTPPPPQRWSEALANRLREAWDEWVVSGTRQAMLWLQRRRAAAEPGATRVREVAELVTADLMTKAAAVGRAGDSPKADDSYRAAYSAYPEAGHRAEPSGGGLGRVAGVLLHPAGRWAAGVVLVAVGLAWLFANGVRADAPTLPALVRTPEGSGRPLASAGGLVGSLNPLFAGVGLLASLAWRSRWKAVGAWAAAAVMTLAPFGLISKPIGPFGPAHVAVALGLVVGGLLAMWQGKARAGESLALGRLSDEPSSVSTP